VSRRRHSVRREETQPGSLTDRPLPPDDVATLSGVLMEALRLLIRELVDQALHEELAVLGAPLPTRDWLTLTEAGDLLGCSADAVRMRARRGRLDCRHQGRRLYVSAASVEALGHVG
jgi:DNA-directed RNA polymerase specialized sigma24 family protein